MKDNNGSKKWIDIYMHIPTIAKFSRLYDNPNADFFIAYYDDLICYKYEGQIGINAWLSARKEKRNANQ